MGKMNNLIVLLPFGKMMRKYKIRVIIINNLEKLIQIANEKHDGHFTLMKFTTNWRCCFGSIYEALTSTYYMPMGKTMDEAIEKCITENISACDIYKKLKDDGIID